MGLCDGSDGGDGGIFRVAVCAAKCLAGAGAGGRENMMIWGSHHQIDPAIARHLCKHQRVNTILTVSH